MTYRMFGIILVVLGCLAWARSFDVPVVRAQEESFVFTRDRDENDKRGDRWPINQDATSSRSDSVLGDASTPTPKKSPTPTPTDTPEATAEATPAPTDTPKAEKSRTLASIVQFFKNGPGANPPSEHADRGLNLFGSDSGGSLYSSAQDSEKKVWYGLIGVLALLGISTFMYGRSKHI